MVANAGDGALKDKSDYSVDLREYRSQISSGKIAGCVEHCLSSTFAKGGMVLQDPVNELGRRLDYNVTNGRYRGTTNAIGSDGTWHSPQQHSIVLEIETTDAYRIALDTIARYRSKLIELGRPLVFRVAGCASSTCPDPGSGEQPPARWRGRSKQEGHSNGRESPPMNTNRTERRRTSVTDPTRRAGSPGVVYRSSAADKASVRLPAGR